MFADAAQEKIVKRSLWRRVSALLVMAIFYGSKGRYYAAYMCFGSVWLLLL